MENRLELNEESMPPTEPKYLTIDELRTFYHLIEKQYIGYGNQKAIALVRKVRNLIGAEI